MQSNSKVLFFSPYSGIWEHAKTQALLAQGLKAQGHTVSVYTCGGALNSFCAAMPPAGLHYTSSRLAKKRVCLSCKSKSRFLRSHFDFSGDHFDASMDDKSRRRIESIVGQTTPDNILSLDVEGVPIGRAALYELILTLKKLELKFSDEEWSYVLETLRNTLKVFFSFKAIFDREKPDALLVYNSLLSANAAVCHLARTRGIPYYFVHSGLNHVLRESTLMIGQRFTWHFLHHLISLWPQFKDRPCAEEKIAAVADHFIELLKAKDIMVYSSPQSGTGMDVRSFFGVSKNQSLLVASMSSYDERFAVETVGAATPDETLLFPRQIDWIRALIDYVRSRPQLFLLIRVHPREFPNRRDGVKSEHAALLEEALKNLPSNARVNWPSDRVSAYDLASEADVFLNAWSSVGKEMSLLGIPVVVYSPSLLVYTSDLNYVGTTRESYFQQIERALQDGWSAERIRKTFRWLVLEGIDSMIRVHPGEPPPTVSQSFVAKAFRLIQRTLHPQGPLNASLRGADISQEQARVLSRMILEKKEHPVELLKALSPSTTLEKETAALKRHMGRIVTLMYGERPSSGVRTKLENNLRQFISTGV